MDGGRLPHTRLRADLPSRRAVCSPEHMSMPPAVHQLRLLGAHVPARVLRQGRPGMDPPGKAPHLLQLLAVLPHLQGIAMHAGKPLLLHIHT